MKVEEVKIRGSQGEATVSRSANHVVVQVEAVQVRAVWDAHARKADEQEVLARRLQRVLDGYRGTNGDVAAYRRVIDMLAD